MPKLTSALFCMPIVLNLDWDDALGIEVHLSVLEFLVCNRITDAIAYESI